MNEAQEHAHHPTHKRGRPVRTEVERAGTVSETIVQKVVAELGKSPGTKIELAMRTGLHLNTVSICVKNLRARNRIIRTPATSHRSRGCSWQLIGDPRAAADRVNIEALQRYWFQRAPRAPMHIAYPQLYALTPELET
jgi:ribosomal protein S25